MERPLTTSTTDLIITTNMDDTVTGTATTYQAGDRVLDSYTTDNDTMNVEYNAATPAATITNIENVNMSVSNVAVVAVDATNFSGVKNLTVTRTDAVIGGSTIVGNKAVDVNALNADNVLKVTTGAGTTNVDIDQDTKAGVTIEAATATGTMTVEGAATINADNATGAFDINDMNDTTEDAKAITINAAKAASVDTDLLFTGAITINAAAANGATAINVQNAVGGVTIVAGTTSTADTTITVDNIDASGASITTGTGSSTSTDKEISIVLDGTTGTTDAATIAAAGYISLDIDHAAAQNVDVLTLSSNAAGTAVTYAIATPGTGTFTSATITSDVTLQGNESVFSGTTITGDGVINMNAGTAGTIDLSKVAVSNVKVGFDNTANVITVASGAKLDLMSDQTGLDIDFSNSGAGGVLTLVARVLKDTHFVKPATSV
ncbi:MAG: hypothetical protein FIA89_16535 [Geobacter sp.]|nr:hypothetical protein [Geobacter sp.]